VIFADLVQASLGHEHVEGLPACGGESGGDALTDQLQRRGSDQTGVDQVMGGGLVTATAAVEEQVGLGAKPKLGSACGDRAQNCPVASAEGVHAGHDGLRCSARVPGQLVP